MLGTQVPPKEASKVPIPLRVLDPESMLCSQLTTSGAVPVARGGHTARPC